MNRSQLVVKVLLSALLMLGLAGVFFAGSRLVVAQQGSIETGEGVPNTVQSAAGGGAAELTPMAPLVDALTGDGFAPLASKPVPAAASMANAVQQSHWTILGSHFQGRSSSLQFTYSANGCIYVTNSGGEIRMQMPVNLPDGSIIKTMEIFYQDTVASDLAVWLSRYIPGSMATDVALVASSGSAGYGISSSPELNHLVDNTQAYSLNYSWGGVLNNTLMLCGVRINYIDPFYTKFLPVITK